MSEPTPLEELREKANLIARSMTFVTEIELDKLKKHKISRREYSDNVIAFQDVTTKTIEQLINAEVLAALTDLKGWVERNHMHPEDFKDRWYVAALEIRNHIEELEKQRYGGKEQK